MSGILRQKAPINDSLYPGGRELIVFLLSLSLVTTASASSLTTNKKKLSTINHSIAKIKGQLTLAQQQRHHYQQQLQQAELAVSKLSNQASHTNQSLKKKFHALSAVERKISSTRTAIVKQRDYLAKQIKAAYLSPRPPFLKLVLEHANANDIDRQRRYYYYIAQQQANTIRTLTANLKTLAKLEQRNKNETTALTALQKTQHQQRHQLQKLKKQRQSIIHKINRQILTKNQRLQQLFNNKRLLENTIRSLRHRKFKLEKMHFDKRRGVLQWPIRGEIHNQFGRKIYHSELQWNGVVISANTNTPVRNIAKGQVIFADWLPGYGLLMIINHGHGYMSLYGRNHRLLRKVGSFVHESEVVATVGNSGGYSRPGLYFAIRHNAKPLDPTLWCH